MGLPVYCMHAFIIGIYTYIYVGHGGSVLRFGAFSPESLRVESHSIAVTVSTGGDLGGLGSLQNMR